MATPARGLLAANAASPSTSGAPSATPTHPVFESVHWGGAALINIDPAENYTFVSCSFAIPTVSVPANVPATQLGEWKMGVSCALDGDLNESAIAAAGIEASIVRAAYGKEIVTYQAVASWFPSTDLIFPVNVKPGDEVYVSVQGLSTSSAIATFTNLSSGKKGGELYLQSPSSDSRLDGSSADFITNRVLNATDGTIAPLADFGTVEINNIVANTQINKFNLNTSPHSNIINMVSDIDLSPVVNVTDPSGTTVRAVFVAGL